MRSPIRASLIFVTLFTLGLTAPALSRRTNLRDGTLAYEPERFSIRCVFFGTDSVSGSYSIDYGSPQWSPEYDSGFDELTLGKRVRFGKDQWTTLDTSCALSLSKVDVKPGLYDCVLERSKKGDFALVLLDSNDVRKSRLDPSASAQTKGGSSIPLDYAKDSKSQPTLTITIEKDAQNEKEQTLTIAFGPHRLTTRVKAKI